MFRQVAGLIAGMVPHRAHLRESPPISLPESDARATATEMVYEMTTPRSISI